LKKAFSLLMTLFFILFLAVIGLISLRFSAFTSRHAADVSFDTRADLMLRAATEYAILAMHGHDYNNSCLKNVNIAGDKFFDINITYHYFLTDCNSSKCSGYCSKINTADTNGSALIYVIVTSKNPTFHIRKVRYTLQNP
jgi:hypothetical protein